MKAVYRLALQSGVGHGMMLLMACLAVLSSFVAVLPPHFLGAIVNAVSGEAGVYSSFPALNRMMEVALRVTAQPIIAFSLLFFLSSCLAVVVRNIFVLVVSVCANRFVLHTRKACIAALTGSRRRDIAAFSSGDLVHRVMMDSIQLHYLVGTPLYVLLSDLFDLLWVAFFIALLDWRILLVLASVFPLLYVLGRRTGRRRRAIARESQEAEAECTGYVQRLLSGLDTIKVFGAEERERRGFSRLLDGIYTLEKRSSFSLGAFFCLEGALRAAGTIAAVAYSAVLALDEPAYAGSIPVLILYAQKFYAPLGNWARFYQVIQKSVVSFRRIRDVLDLPEEGPGPRPLAAGEHSGGKAPSVFPFAVRGNVLLDSGGRVGLDLTLDGPGLVIVRGRSGVGKTQFARSLLSLGPPFEGEVRAGTLRLNGDNLLLLRPLVAFASQEGHFIPGTIARNLAYPDDEHNMDRDRCARLLEDLGLEGFSLDDEVEEYARNLSLGEGRRLTLGRALYSLRPVLLLDEIDANVDPETRKRLYALIERERHARAVIMITHVNAAELRHIEHTCIVLGDGAAGTASGAASGLEQGAGQGVGRGRTRSR